jgi:oligopeptide transport system substrate-binding protein
MSKPLMKFILATNCALLLFCGAAKDPNLFCYRLSSGPVSLDPALASDANSAAVVQEIFDGLVEINPQTGTIVPAVAERWEVLDSGKAWVFHIRPGVRFHNSRLVNAGDFLYSFERALNPKTRCPRTWVLEPILGANDFMSGKTPTVSGIQVLDSLTLKITLEKSFIPFLSHLCMEIASVVPKEEVERWGNEFGFHPVGAGPYKLAKFAPDMEIDLEAFNAYYRPKAQIAKIKYQIVPNDVVAYEQYKSGFLDFLSPVPTGQIASARKIFGNEFHQWPIQELRYLGMNTQKGVLKEHPALRQAISCAIDRKAISNIIYEGVVQPACGILPPGIMASQNDTLCYARNLEKAKELLGREGFPNGKGLPTLTLLYNSREIETRLWQFVKSNLEEAGFSIQLKSLEWGSYLDAVRKGEGDLFRGSWVADYADPHNFLFVLFYSKNAGAAGNYSRYNNPSYDQLVEQAQITSDGTKRQALYQQAEQIIKTDVPICPLFFGGDAILLKNTWSGFTPSVQGVWATPLWQMKKIGKSE